MTIAAGRADRTLALSDLFSSGIAWYARMFRMLLISVVPVGVLALIGAFAFQSAERYGAHAIHESQALRAHPVAPGVPEAITRKRTESRRVDFVGARCLRQRTSRSACRLDREPQRLGARRMRRDQQSGRQARAMQTPMRMKHT
jgi:hypothetical protein